MKNARVITQLVCAMPTKVGLLADIAEALAAADVNVTAMCAYESDDRGEFMLVTSDNAKATQALEAMGGEVTTQSAVAVDMPDRPGALAEVARAIGDAGINIQYTYGSTTQQESATIIFSTADDEYAVSKIG